MLVRLCDICGSDKQTTNDFLACGFTVTIRNDNIMADLCHDCEKAIAKVIEERCKNGKTHYYGLL